MSEQPVPRQVVVEAERQHRLIMRGTAYGDEGTRRAMSRELMQRLTGSIADGTPLRVYLGVDPTSPDLHIGHCVTLRKLRLFQQLGHQAILLIGDFTRDWSGILRTRTAPGRCRRPRCSNGTRGPTASRRSSCWIRS